MYAVVRRYQGASQLFDEVARRQGELEQVFRGVPGFLTYTAVRSGDGGITITICEDRAGTEESSRRAADWVRQTVPAAAGSSPPAITEGEVLYQFGR